MLSFRPVPEEQQPTRSNKIETLRDAAASIVTRRDALKVWEQLQQTLQETETALRTLDDRREKAQGYDRDIQRRLPQVYRDPRAALEAIRDRIDTEGLIATVRAMREKPESFGRLQGRDGLLKDAARSDARGIAATVAFDLPAAEEARRRVAADAGERKTREAAIAAARAQLQDEVVPDVPNGQQLRAMLKAVPAAQRRQLMQDERRVLADTMRADRAVQRTGSPRPARGHDLGRDYEIKL